MFNILLSLGQTGYFALRSPVKAAGESGGLSRPLPVKVADAVIADKVQRWQNSTLFHFSNRLSSILGCFAT